MNFLQRCLPNYTQRGCYYILCQKEHASNMVMASQLLKKIIPSSLNLQRNITTCGTTRDASSTTRPRDPLPNTARDPITPRDTVRVGCASGFWGDTSVAVPQLVLSGHVDYLVFDYMSDVTMSLLSRAKRKDPSLGYAPDFIHHLVEGPVLQLIKHKGIKVISNAGGLNPIACGVLMQKACEDLGLDLKIAVVSSNDLSLDNTGSAENPGNNNNNTNQSGSTTYLGSGPISRSLDLGADIVITGTCIGSALVLAPLQHTFKWDYGDYNRLSAGSLAGHLIGCGAQTTGGMFTDWELVTGWQNIGYPVIECNSDGHFVVSKPARTGGMVTIATVAEQIVHEIGDPRNYELPDVNCDFSHVSLQAVKGKADSVLVTGALGKPPRGTYQVNSTFMDGYRTTAVIPLVGTNAVGKGEKTAKSIIKRCQRIFETFKLKDFKRFSIEMLGSESNYGPLGGNSGTKECVAWIAVEHEQKKALEIFSKEIAPAGTGMAPGLTGIVGGRPSVSPIFKLHSRSYPKCDITIDIHLNGTFVETYKEPKLTGFCDSTYEDDDSFITNRKLRKRFRKGKCSFPLGALAYTRSGNKGNDANIGVVCRNAGYYGILSEVLTADKIGSYFAHLFETSCDSFQVERYNLPGIYAFNFVLKDVLGGGGITSLRSDPQGRALGQMLLDFKVKDMPDLLPSTYDRSGQYYGL